MAISLPAASSVSSPGAFDRHIKRLAWCALLGSLALLVPELGPASYIGWGLTEALGAMIVVIAVLDVVRDISRYVRYEATRRREAVRASAQVGACRAAEAIQDRVANLLSVTVGYADFVAEDEHLSEKTLEHARQARDSALEAARAVSVFRRSLDCSAVALPDAGELRLQLTAGASHVTEAGHRHGAWTYDAATRSVRAEDGSVVAKIERRRDRSAEVRSGRLIAMAPALWEVLADAQRVALKLLAETDRPHAEVARIRELLERINSVSDTLES